MLEENPRRRRRNPKKGKGRRKAKKVTVTVRANPKHRSGRRRRNPAPMVHRHRSGRRRRNPAGETWMAIGAQAAGGAAAVGVEYALSKIPSLTGYYFLAVDALTPIALGIGAQYAKLPNIARGMVGVGGYKLVRNSIAAYALYDATEKLKDASKQGQKGLGSMGSIRQLSQPNAVSMGYGSMRTGVRAR